MRVFINPGHGGKDPGAVGFGLQEKDVVLAVGLKVCEILRRHGVDVLMNRTSDTFDDLHEITAKANGAGADLFVSIHANAASSTSAHGVETFHFPTSVKGKKLATAVQQSIIADKSLFHADRGVKEARFYVLRHTVMPAALVELAFITNERDSELLRTKQDEFAEAIVKGIMGYMGVEVKKGATTTDYKGHWAEKEIDEAVKGGLMVGDEQGRFRPDDPITRAEVVVMLSRLKKVKPTDATSGVIYYQKGNFHVIEGDPLDVKIKLTGGHTLNGTGEPWAINGTFFDTPRPSLPESCWQIAVSDGKVLGPNAFTNSYAGHKKGTMVCFTDGRVIMNRFNNINEIAKQGEVKWAIGGNAVYPDYDLRLERAAPDISRHAMHTLMAYTADKRILLLITKEPRHLDRVVHDLKNTFVLTSAINLDGGGSTAMVADGKKIVDQGRRLNNIVIFS